jgi:translin
MSLDEIKSSLDTISKSLSKTLDAREDLIRNTRDIVLLSSKAIISIHGGDLKIARENIAKASRLLKKYQKKAVGNIQYHIITPEQELVEAITLLSVVEGKKIPSFEKFHVSEEAYILGLLDSIGEMKRLVYDKIRTDNLSDAEKIFEIMDNLYQTLYPFAVYDKIVRETRRKLDVARMLVEDTRSAVTEEIRRAKLIESVKKLEKKFP